jgi:molybdate transport system substrate-binding protein
LAKRLAVLLAAAIAVVVAGCGSSTSSTTSSGAGATPSQAKGTVTVLAAASLTDAFNKIGSDLEARNPGLKAKFSYAGSPTLVQQIQQGAPADVFASADQPNMDKVVSGGQASGKSQVFAHNRLQIVVAAGNPKKISSVTDLANPALKVDVCAPGVPCGTYATTVFNKSGVKVTPVSQEDNVKAVVTKVSLGEADAGVVYRTDVQAGGSRVQGVDIPANHNVVAAYPMVQLKTARNGAGARAFMDEVMSAHGQQVLEQYGFIVGT